MSVDISSSLRCAATVSSTVAAKSRLFRTYARRPSTVMITLIVRRFSCGDKRGVGLGHPSVVGFGMAGAPRALLELVSVDFLADDVVDSC